MKCHINNHDNTSISNSTIVVVVVFIIENYVSNHKKCHRRIRDVKQWI